MKKWTTFVNQNKSSLLLKSLNHLFKITNKLQQGYTKLQKVNLKMPSLGGLVWE